VILYSVECYALHWTDNKRGTKSGASVVLKFHGGKQFSALASLVSSWRVNKGCLQLIDMDRLREAIELLSKLLHENASLKIRAEVFRAAKFNNVEAVLLFFVMFCTPAQVPWASMTT